MSPIMEIDTQEYIDTLKRAHEAAVRRLEDKLSEMTERKEIYFKGVAFCSYHSESTIIRWNDTGTNQFIGECPECRRQYKIALYQPEDDK